MNDTKNDVRGASLKLEAIELCLNIAFQNFSDGFIYKDVNHIYKYINNSACAILGISDTHTVLGKSYLDFFSSKNNNLINDIDKRIIQNNETINYILSINNDNQEKYLALTSYPVMYKGILYGIATVIRDTTQEEKLKEQFVSKHFQLKLLLENIPLIIYMQDEKSKYITGSKHAKAFVNKGYDVLNKIKINTEDFKYEDNYDNRIVIKKNKTLIREKCYLDKNNRQHCYKFYKIPIADYNDNVTGVITIANNADTEKQLQKQKETFVATLGHDLKNPTIAQIRSIELLIKEKFGKLSLEQKELLTMVLDSCLYMKGMLSALLDTYRNYGGSIILHFEDFLLEDLLSECVAEMNYIAKDKEICIHIKSSLENQYINGDKIQIKRVIMNLLSNGIKYAYKNSQLNLSLYMIKTDVYFEFENKSPYIPKEIQKTIFAQYVSYSDTFKQHGTGLGLYASDKIIRSHGGKMYVHSFKDNRNIFGFKIPITHTSNKECKICF